MPAHTTLRVRRDVRSLRGGALFRAIHQALCGGNWKEDFRLVDYSVQRNHFHFTIEARSPRALSRGMQGLAIRLARAINRKLRRRGKVFRDRFFSRLLRDPIEARNARRYVLNNARHHARGAQRNATTWTDPCSSAPFFDGWTVPEGTPVACHDQHAEALVPLGSAAVAPRTWLMTEGWAWAGPLVVNEIPGPID